MSSLKRIEGRFYSPGNVVMLTTYKSSPLKTDLNGDLLLNSNMDYVDDVIFKHIYILCDEEFKDGDWVINPSGYPEIFAHDWRAQWSRNEIMKCKKILATTDDLRYPIYDEDKLIMMPLPNPSKSFILKYVEEYQKGKPITDVLVEYDYTSTGNLLKIYSYTLKINKDNEIKIKKTEKKVYTQEEVDDLLDRNTSQTTSQLMTKYKNYKSNEDILLLIDIWVDSQEYSNRKFGKIPPQTFDEWLKENL